MGSGNTKTKAEHAAQLRYKQPALASLGWENLINGLYDIQEACSDVHWFFEDDGDNLLAAMDGDEDAVYEFKMAFAELEAKCDSLYDAIKDDYDIGEYFDDCTVALIGNRYRLVGYDSYEEDYYNLSSFDSELAVSEAGKRCCRWTKAELLSKIGQCMGIVLAFFDLRQSYDYLKATMDFLRDENTSVLQIIKDIETAYEEAEKERFDKYAAPTHKFEILISQLPDRIWIE